MHALRNVLFITTLTLVSTATMAGTRVEADAGARLLWFDAILSGYRSLAIEARSFSEASERYCQAPGPATREAAEHAWLAAFLAWQRVRFVDFGPIESQNTAWQFQFWPDPKNLIARKAQGLISAGEPVTPERVAQSGVAVQGFPMAEYLLFDSRMAHSDQRLPATTTCGLLVAVANHILANSERLATDWHAFREHYLGTEQYLDATIRAGMAGLEQLEERRLAQPMGLRGTGKRSIYAADAWRSGQSLRAAEASLNGLQTYFWPGLETLLTGARQSGLAGRIETQFGEALSHFPELRQPLAGVLADDTVFARLQGFYVDVSQLAVLVNGEAAVALGVVRGFNSSDGD